MTIKRILVPVEEADWSAAAVETVLVAAKELDAHVDALLIELPRPAPPTAARTGYVPYGEGASVGGPVDQVMADDAERRERRHEAVRVELERMCEPRGIKLVDGSATPELPSVSCLQVQGTPPYVVTERARGYDLIVATSGALARSLMEIADGSVLEMRRPVLLAPARLEHGLGRSVMIAWDGSVECWHAVTAALPFLESAERVEVVSVGSDPETHRASQAEVLAYLGLHGVQATARVVAPVSRTVGEMLLTEAGESQVGLLVMGAYSHSRLRERLIGGATRHVLANAAATPVLMAH
jgi:nucleotide-binding universal stress UspA family protein